MVSLSQLEHANPLAILGVIDSWKTSAKDMLNRADDYLRAVTLPGGQAWSGQTRDAMVAMAGKDHAAIEYMHDAIDAMADAAANGITFSVIKALGDVRALIAEAESPMQGFHVNDDLSVTDLKKQTDNTPDPKRTQLRDTYELNIKRLARKWWETDQAVANQIDKDKKDVAAKFNALGALNAGDGQHDGADLASHHQLSPGEQQRLIQAGTLTPDQLAALARDEKVNVGAGRMAYLYQLSQSLNGKSPAEIKALTNDMSPQARVALAQGFAIVSNKNALSGVPNTAGVSDATRNDLVPAAGSLANLPKGIVNELARTDRVSTTRQLPNPFDRHTILRGVGGLQDMAEVLRPAGGAYLNGSEATKSMLAAASQYAAADAAHRGLPESWQTHFGLPVDKTAGLFSDQHGGGWNVDPRGALAEVFQVAGNDHVGVHDLVTNPATRDGFLHGVLSENWGAKGGQVGDAFRWTGDPANMTNPIASETASSLAHYVSEQKVALQHMPGGGTFGYDSPGLAQSLAQGVGPYLAQLAGGAPETGFTAAHVGGFANEEGMRDLFSVLDQNLGAGTTLNDWGIKEQQIMVVDAGQHGVHGNEVEIASRLNHAMLDGAVDTQQYGHYNGNDTQRNQEVSAAGKLFTSGYAALTAFSAVGGPLPPTTLNALGPEFNRAIIGADPTTVEHPGDNFFENQLTSGDRPSLQFTVDRNATVLQGLLNAHPEIANDPRIQPFLYNGRVDFTKVGDVDHHADRNLSDWFAENSERYNLRALHDQWEDGENRGWRHKH